MSASNDQTAWNALWSVEILLSDSQLISCSGDAIESFLIFIYLFIFVIH